MKENDGNELVLAQVYDSDIRAHIALGILRTNGIPCILDNEIARNVLGIQLAPLDGIRLLVREKDLDEALKLIKDV